MLKKETIASIRALGLFIQGEPFFPETHIAWPSGYTISKAASVPGNGHPYAESFCDDGDGNEVATISPSVHIWNAKGKTHIEVSEYAPGPGPSDFKQSFDTEEQAVESVKHYYFDPDDSRFKIWLELNQQWAAEEGQ